MVNIKINLEDIEASAAEIASRLRKIAPRAKTRTLNIEDIVLALEKHKALLKIKHRNVVTCLYGASPLDVDSPGSDSVEIYTHSDGTYADLLRSPGLMFNDGPICYVFHC